MGKEAKIGIGVIAILLVVFCVVLFKKFAGGKDATPATVPSPAANATESPATSGAITKGASVMSASGSDEAAPTGANGQGDPFDWRGGTSRRQDDADAGPRSDWRMPDRNTLPQQRAVDERFGGDSFDRTKGAVPQDGGETFDPFDHRNPLRGGAPVEADHGGHLTPAPEVRLRPSPEAIRTGATEPADDWRQGASTTPGAGGALQAESGRPSATDLAQNDSRSSMRGDAFVPATGLHSPSRRGSRTGQFQTAVVGDEGLGEPTNRLATSDASAYPQQGAVQSPQPQIAARTEVDAVHTGSHRVGPNDNLWTISQKVYGTGGFFKALAEHNRKKYPDPNDLQVGDVIDTPDAALLRQNYPVLCPKERPRAAAGYYREAALQSAKTAGREIYVVQEGDTLFRIAKSRWGDQTRAWEILQLNRDLLGSDAAYLKPGWKLVLPGNETVAEPSETLTRRPEPTYNR